MKMTIKGQVTIPRSIRDRLGLRPGDNVAFIERDADVVVRKQGPKTAEEREAEIDAWVAKVRGTADSGWTTDEILDMTRGPERRR